MGEASRTRATGKAAKSARASSHENQTPAAPTINGRLYNLTGPFNHRFFGLEMAQNALVPALFNRLLEEQQPARVIEIGCCKGGLSHLFALGASLLGYEFFTYDVRDSLRYPLAKAHHETVDIFEIDLGPIITGYGTTLLLCDGGDKRREFNTFAPLLKPGDIVGAHDLCIGDRYWAWSEISEADVQDTCELHRLVPFMQAEFAPAGWLMRRKAPAVPQ